MIHRKKEVLNTAEWSGGSTTELFIDSPEASYTARNFEVRISTATVETETSEFTSLPGYQRLLMVLAGNLVMHHRVGLTETRNSSLKPFDQAAFDGAWATTAEGKVTDFNVMFSKAFTADLSAKRLTKGGVCVLSPPVYKTICYLYKGQLASGNLELNAGDVCILEPDDQSFTWKAEQDSVLIITHLFEHLR